MKNISIEGDRSGTYWRREVQLNIQMARTFRELQPLSPVQTVDLTGRVAVSRSIEYTYLPVDLGCDTDGNKGPYKATIARRYYLNPTPRRTETGEPLPRDFIHGLAETALAVTIQSPVVPQTQPRPLDYFMSDSFDVNAYLEADHSDELQVSQAGSAEFQTYRYTDFTANFNARRQPSMIRERRRFRQSDMDVRDEDFIEQYQTFLWLDLIMKSRSER